ncbi:hypothetical protein H0H93_000186 [Arthromyces matolae]|nr:hypothetical protein H0H93_000186 [Arthromyces matolae]
MASFRYPQPSRRISDSHDISSHISTIAIAPADTSLNRDIQPTSARWPRTTFQPQSQSPASFQTQHQPQHHYHHQQQHTPPLSAGHEPSQPKNDYSSKPDGNFMTPGVPLSAQSTPVPGSITIGPGTRGDDANQSRRRRSSGTMSAPRDQRNSHAAYPPHYAPYPPSQPQQPNYQIQAPISQPGPPAQPAPPVQQPIEHVAPQQLAPPPHPGYPNYQAQYPPPPAPIQLHAAPQQQQAPPTNPYPAPGPPPHNSWDQPHHPPPPHQQHQQPPPPPPPQLQQPPAHHPPQHGHQMQHAHSMPQHPPPPPPLQSQHHQIHPQHAQQQHPVGPSPPLGHHAPTHAQPQHQQPPPQMQQPQLNYPTRTTAIVPMDTRTQYPAPEERMPAPTVRDSTMGEIMEHCRALFNFASRYAQLQQSMPDVCPMPEELQEMSQRAAEVVRLLEEYRRLNLPESERVKLDNAVAMTPPDDHRPPKRPWEDLSQEETSNVVETNTFAEQYPTPVENKSTAEQDMEIIRTKRATSTAGASGSSGQPKNYAKLQRKKEKQAGPNGEVERIDLETLRASARAAEVSEKSSSRSKHAKQSNDVTSPMETGKPLPQQHHQGSFQLMPMVVAQDTTPSESNRAPPPPPPPQQQQQQHTPISSAPPPAPWSTSVHPSSTIRAYAPEQLQHQSFMRTPHQAPNHTHSR